MKKNIMLLVIGIYISSCSIEYVKTIEYKTVDNSITYKDSKGNVINDKSNAFIKEGAEVNVIIKNSNPVSTDVSVTQGEPVVYYQDGKNNPMLAYINTTNTASSNTVAADTNKKNGITPTILPAPKNKADSDRVLIEEVYRSIADAKEKMKHFEGFYNDIAKLNYVLSDFGYSPTLDATCICSSLNPIINSLITQISKPEDPDILKLNQCNSDKICNFENPGELILKNTSHYKIMLDSLVNDLIDLQTRVSKQKIKDEKPAEVLAAAIKELNNINSKIADKYLADITATIEKLKQFGTNNLKFEETVGPFIPEQTDLLKLTIAQNNKIKNKTINKVINLPVTRALKIDYSAGLFASRLSDETYKITKPTDTTYKITTQNNGFSYGSIGYINFHPHTRIQWFSVGGSIGAGLMFNNNAKLVLSPTASFIFGKYQRVIVHIGGAVSQIDKIEDINQGNPFKDAVYKPEIKKVASINWLFGITWNLSR